MLENKGISGVLSYLGGAGCRSEIWLFGCISGELGVKMGVRTGFCIASVRLLWNAEEKS